MRNNIIPGLEFKIATEDREFEQIHELNYETFVEEIPQHASNGNRSLVDKFHDENTYIICLEDGRLLGMLAVRDNRPFSLDGKIASLDSYLPAGRSLCEIRLLSVRKERRHRKVLLGLFTMLAGYCEEKRYDLALISGNVEQERLYANLGFKPFGPRVGTDGAIYQPMCLTPGSYYGMKERTKLLSRMKGSATRESEPLNLLPGPVDVCPEAKEAMAHQPVSHRSQEFIDDLNSVRKLLCELTHTRTASILMGSGTLANDALGAQLSLGGAKGLVLSNGEFGERLMDHASRWNLAFDAVKIGWGEVFDYAEVENLLDCSPETGWLWAVHSETSTGVLNDVKRLKEICTKRDIALCLDCISSIGTVPLNLEGVHMATGVSGKGLRSYPGISFVLHNHFTEPAPGRLPRYLDLGLYSGAHGNPFTVSSNLLCALKASLEAGDFQNRYTHIKESSLWLRQELRQAGFSILAGEGHESPALVTVALPASISSRELGLSLEREGYLIHWRSGYLRERNWIQIALMGECVKSGLRPLLDLLADLTACRLKVS